MEENRDLKLDFFQGILLFVIGIPYVFLEQAKQIFLFLMHSNDDHEKIAIIHPPLKIAHAYPHCINDFDKSFTARPCDDHDQVGKPHKSKADVSPSIPSPTSSKSQHRYIPLKLPQVLHDSLQITMNIYLCLMEKLMSSQLKSTSKGLRIS
jgi:hypothetical protein